MRVTFARSEDPFGDIRRIPIGEVVAHHPPGIVRGLAVGVLVGLLAFAAEGALNAFVGPPPKQELRAARERLAPPSSPP